MNYVLNESFKYYFDKIKSKKELIKNVRDVLASEKEFHIKMKKEYQDYIGQNTSEDDCFLILAKVYLQDSLERISELENQLKELES